jgi:hypothetical protein
MSALEYHKGLAKTLPVIPVDDFRVQKILQAPPHKRDELYDQSFGPFGNDFHLLFEGLVLQSGRHPLDDVFFGPKVAQAQSLGDRWQKYVSDHHTQELLSRFDEVLEEGRSYEEFDAYVADLVLSGRQTELGILKRTFFHPLGLRAPEAVYNDRRNSVLAVAAAAMWKFSINPEQFYA